MWNARTYRTASVEDIYAGIEDGESGVPSCRRVTLPVARPKHLTMIDGTAAADRSDNVAALKDQVRSEIEKSELTAAAVRSGDVVPDQSMRRIKVARRVVGVPETIHEQISEQCLRDPRRD